MWFNMLENCGRVNGFFDKQGSETSQKKKFIWQCDEWEYVDNEAENDDEKLYLYILYIPENFFSPSLL